MADASALVEYLLRTDRALPIERVIRAPDAELNAPALCDVEFASAVRRALLRRELQWERAALAIDAYVQLPLTRHGHESLLGRILDFRENFSAYDATYVVLAEQLGGALLTADERLARAVRSHTQLVILP